MKIPVAPLLVSPVAGVTYAWTLTRNGVITSSATGTSITFSAQPSGTISLTVTASNAVTYVYRVRAIDSASTWSKPANAPMDFATTATILFAEGVAAGQLIEASHVAELQKAVDAFRVASGLSPAFSGAPSLVGAPIAAADFTALTSALNTALSAWSRPPFSYAGVPPPASGGIIYTAHVTQLREAVR